MNALYTLIYFIGFLIRQFVLPNPFEPLCPEYAVVLKWGFEGVLVLISYAIVGRLYHHGDDATWGSFLFNVVCIGLTLFLWAVLTLINVVLQHLIISIVIASIVAVITITVIIICKVRTHRE